MGTRSTPEILPLYQSEKMLFYQNEVCFLGYVVSSKDISMEVKKIEVVKDWLEPKSIRKI